MHEISDSLSWIRFHFPSTWNRVWSEVVGKNTHQLLFKRFFNWLWKESARRQRDVIVTFGINLGIKKLDCYVIIKLCSSNLNIDSHHTTPNVNVTWLNGNTVAVNCEVVHLSEHTYQVRLRSFLKSKKGCWLKPERLPGIQIAHNLTNERLKW